MPLRPGHSDEVREQNIKEMIDAGHEPQQAVAAAYTSQRKYQKMADGGSVEPGMLSQIGDWVDKKTGNYTPPPDKSKQTGQDTSGADKLGQGWKAAGYAEGGRVEEDRIEGEIADENRGLYDIQKSSQSLGEDLVEDDEYDKMIAHALSFRQNLSDGGEVESQEDSAMPDAHFANEARKSLMKRKKK